MYKNHYDLPTRIKAYSLPVQPKLYKIDVVTRYKPKHDSDPHRQGAEVITAAAAVAGVPAAGTVRFATPVVSTPTHT